MSNMEKIKALVVHILNRAIASYLRRNRVKVIAVAGSIGKTSTTNAIRTVLAQQYRVHVPKTAYNTTKSVHLELFDMQFATSFLGWTWATVQMLLKSLGTAPYEVVVIEIGTDFPGELQTFAWLKPELGVLTAIAPEHMEQFKTIEAVAKEELSITEFCRELVFNANRVDRQFVPAEVAEQAMWYGQGTDFRAAHYKVVGTTVRADFTLGKQQLKNLELQVLGEHSLDALTAAATVASRYGLSEAAIKTGLQAITAVRGRMQRLAGVDDATIIDDSYNASPQACKAALDVLYQFEVPQRIAVLGMMNEMGEYSEQAHREVGDYCNPKKLDWVVTIGADANKYLADAAKRHGCQVRSFDSPYQAGNFVKQQLKSGAAVLFKGSQNGVFAEEAIKAVLADPADQVKLVRQSDFWMQRKRQQFGPR